MSTALSRRRNLRNRRHRRWMTAPRGLGADPAPAPEGEGFVGKNRDALTSLVYAVAGGGLGLYALYRFANRDTEGNAKELFKAGAAASGASVTPTPFNGLLKPIEGGVVTSKYGYRINPTSHLPEIHNGIDFGVGVGTPILAPANAKVVGITVASPDDPPVFPAIKWKQPNGNSVLIDVPRPDGSSLQFVFLHMSRVDVQVGQVVSRGQQLGLSGNTGQSTGPHVHTSMTKNRVWKSMVDPMSVPEVAQMLA